MFLSRLVFKLRDSDVRFCKPAYALLSRLETQLQDETFFKKYENFLSKMNSKRNQNLDCHKRNLPPTVYNIER